MRCSNCGTELVGGDRFCNKCGTAVILPVTPPPTQPTARGKKKTALILVAVLLLIALGVGGFFGYRAWADSLGDEPEAVLRGEETETVETEPATTAPAETEPAPVPTEDQRILLTDGSWENGHVTVMALDAGTLWVQVMDNRPDQQYGDLGTPWRVEFEFGTEMVLENGSGGYAVNYPYRICLSSLADRELLTREYEQGNTSEYFVPAYLRNLYICQTEPGEGAYDTAHEERIDLLEIEKEGDTYTAVITLPEWVGASLYSDLTAVTVSLRDTTHWSELYEKGSVQHAGVYRFYPAGP